MTPQRGHVVLLLLLLSGVCCRGQTMGQTTTANTPGGVRVIGGTLDGLDDVSRAALPAASDAGDLVQQQQQGVSGDSGGGGDADSGSGQLLFQSIPDFGDKEMQALERYTGMLRSPNPQQAGISSGSANRQSSADAGVGHSRSAADDFLEALLKTTRASLASNNPSLRPLQRSAHPGPDSETSTVPQAASSRADADAVDAGAEPAAHNSATEAEEEEEEEEAEPQRDAEAEGGSDAGDGDVQQVQDEPSEDTSPPSTAAAADPASASSSTQQIADTASAVEGQVLVTQAEIIPAMQSYGQVVLTSLKMRPMLAQELLAKVAASPAGAPAAVQAAAWQDNLKQALEAAAALEANVSVAQMHTRMTSILNLGLELAEPPLAYASAAATSVANSIKALTGDESVLVGVSLIRLGSHHQNTATAGSDAQHNSSTGSSTVGAGQHPVHGHAAAAAAEKGSMLAMLTLYGVGAPSNAVQIVQRMQEACPELFAYGAGLTNSSCGRTIASNYLAAVLAAEQGAGGHAAGSGDDLSAAGVQPSRTLLHQERQQAKRGFGFASSSHLTTSWGGSGHSRTFAASATLTASTGSADHGSTALVSAASGDRQLAGSRDGGRGGGVDAAAMSGRAGAGDAAPQHAPELAALTQHTPEMAALAQHTPEMAAFAQHSHSCLRVRQQPEVNIIITQAVGVSAGQQPRLLAQQLQQLSQSTALAELLALSGLSLAQAGKPQVIDLSAAAAAAAGLDRGDPLAAASALGSEAADLGHAWLGSSGSSGDGSSSAGGGGAAKQAEGAGSGGVTTPAVIGMAVAVAVSVVAVCAAAVAIVCVKQRAKQARAAAAADDNQLPQSSKRRRSSKGKGLASKYLPTSHPALAHSPRGPDGIPPPPCVVVTAINSPAACQHTPGHSPCKPCALPGHRSAPLASAGSSALISLGSGPTSGTPAGHSSLAAARAASPALTPLSAHAGLMGPAVTRGDSVSSAVMAEFAEQQQQIVAEARTGGAAGEGEGGEGEEREGRQQGCSEPGEERAEKRQRQHSSGARGAAYLAGYTAGSSSPRSSPLRTQRQQRRMHPEGAPGQQQQQQRASCSNPFQQLRQHWQDREDGSRSSSCMGSPCMSHLQTHALCGASSWAEGEAAAAGSAATHLKGAAAAGVCEDLRLFSRPLSESSLPEDLKAHLTGTSPAAAAASNRAAGAASSSSSGGGGCGGAKPVLPTLRTLHSVSSGSQDRPGAAGQQQQQYLSGPSSSRSVRSSPFMAYDVSVLLCSASPTASSQAGFPAVAAALASSSAAGSSLQFPQWTSSVGSSVLQSGGLLAQGTAGAAAAAAPAAGGGGSTPHGPSRLQQAHEGAQKGPATASPKAAARPTPFSKPGNVPPGL